MQTAIHSTEKLSTSDNKKNHILVVEDEQALSSMIEKFLCQAGYYITCANTIRQAEQLIENYSNNLDLILLDWALPDADGATLIRYVRLSLCLTDIPIVVLTARADEMNKLRAFDMGCDDYVSKPFSLNELERRLRAVLKRYNRNHKYGFHIGELYFNPESQTLHYADSVLSMNKKEFQILQTFAEKPGITLSRNWLLQNLWSSDDVNERTVDVHIMRIRRLFEKSGIECPIKTIWGKGYYLDNKNVKVEVLG